MRKAEETFLAVDQVSLVTDESDHHRSVRVFFHFVEPVFQIQKALPIRHIVDDEGPDRKPVMSRCDVQEVLRARRVPYLSFHFLVAVWERHRAEQKFYSISLLWIRIVNVFSYSQQEIGLSHSFVANDDDFVEVVKYFIWIVQRIRNCRFARVHAPDVVAVASNSQAHDSRSAASFLFAILRLGIVCILFKFETLLPWRKITSEANFFEVRIYWRLSSVKLKVGYFKRLPALHKGTLSTIIQLLLLSVI